jgi:hypothetical protein
MGVKLILWYTKFTLAQANRRSTVTFVGARLVAAVGIQVSNFSPIAKLSARIRSAASQIFVSIRRNRSLGLGGK